MRTLKEIRDGIYIILLTVFYFASIIISFILFAVINLFKKNS